MPVGVYDLPVNIIEMKRGDVLLFNSFLLHTSNINFSNLIRYSIQIRFTSEDLANHQELWGNYRLLNFTQGNLKIKVRMI